MMKHSRYRLVLSFRSLSFRSLDCVLVGVAHTSQPTVQFVMDVLLLASYSSTTSVIFGYSPGQDVSTQSSSSRSALKHMLEVKFKNTGIIAKGNMSPNLRRRGGGSEEREEGSRGVEPRRAPMGAHRASLLALRSSRFAPRASLLALRSSRFAPRASLLALRSSLLALHPHTNAKLLLFFFSASHSYPTSTRYLVE